MNVVPADFEIPDAAMTANIRPRHRAIAWSFLLAVLCPFTTLAVYLWLIAEDQFHSVAGFVVRQEEAAAASELLGGLAQLTGSSASVDADILFQYFQSPSMALKVDRAFDIRSHYSAHWRSDPLFALKPDSSAEELEHYWKRIVRISHDRSSGLIEVHVKAFAPQMAKSIATEIVAQGDRLINEINAQAREDALRYARADLADAVTHLKTAREALKAFRTRTQIVDPEADIQGRMGVMNNLQQGLAEALVDYDILSQTTGAADHRLQQSLRRIEVIRLRIAEERASFSSASEVDGLAANYSDLIAEFESLSVERELAEETYSVALAAMHIARAKAQRQSRYLAVYLEPSLPQTSAYPRRFVIAALAFSFLVLSWFVLVLIYYSIRDRQ